MQNRGAILQGLDCCYDDYELQIGRQYIVGKLVYVSEIRLNLESKK